MVLLDFLPLFPHFFILAYFSRLLGDIPFSPAPPSIALKSSSDNEMTFPRRIPLALKQYPMEQNGSLGANQLLPSSPPCWTFAAHLRVGFDCKQTRVRTTSLVFIYLFVPFHSKPHEDRSCCNLGRIWVSKYGAAPACEQLGHCCPPRGKKNLLSAEIQMATEMKNMIKPSTFISETHLVLLKCSLMTFQGYALTPQWFEFLFLADSQLANK